MTPIEQQPAVTASVTAAKVGSIVAHIRNNNVAYLVGIGIAHMMGLTNQVWSYGSGMC